LVLDIQPGPASSLPRHLKAIGDRLVFAAYDESLGVEAWVTDGTPEGTFRLGDIAPGPLSSSPTHFSVAGDLVFFAANDNLSGFELWALPRASLDSAPSDYFTVTPCRLHDSREGGAVGHAPVRVGVAGRCDVPLSARSVVVNLTVVGGTSAGRLRIGSLSTPPGAIEILPFSVGVARAEMAVLRLTYGELEIGALFDGGTEHSVHTIVDVTGYFQ
jgi:ELWxxDGT repeat protein